MSYSVIIPTYNGENKITACLEALVNQTFKDFEILVAIDGSTDKTRLIVESFRNKFKKVRIIEQENGGRSKIRNFAAENCSSEILIFFDDDMRPLSNVLQSHVDHHLKNASSIFVGGQKSDPSKAKSDFDNYRINREKKWEQSLPKEKGKTTMPFITAAHFSLPRNLFSSLNGFDEKLTDCEDYDLAVRAFENSMPIYLYQDAIAYHDDPLTLKNYISRKRQYAQALILLKKLYPERYSKYNERTFTEAKGIKKMIFNTLSSSNLVKNIDRKKSILKFLPSNWRYKVYDLIIQGLTKYNPHIKLQS